jgi:hypothetical protein
MTHRLGRTLWKNIVLVIIVIFAGCLLYSGFELWRRAANP